MKYPIFKTWSQKEVIINNKRFYSKFFLSSLKHLRVKQTIKKPLFTYKHELHLTEIGGQWVNRSNAVQNAPYEGSANRSEQQPAGQDFHRGQSELQPEKQAAYRLETSEVKTEVFDF